MQYLAGITHPPDEMINLSCRASRVALLLFFLINCLAVSAQKEPVIWLFGDHNGIDFRSGAPVAITNPNTSYHGAEVRGVATVTDANGNLLFYAENETVYNNQHDTMQNGSGMNSVWAATQTGLTIRAIHDTSLFYLFTINMYEINGMSYSSPDLWCSVIDMKANNGLGAVTIKNIPLFGISTTQLCAVRHCNERDIWVISHEWESDAYYAFLITPEGISNPVISRSGRYVGTSATSNFYGYMKASPDGKKIASSWSSMGVDLSDFDNETGIVSNSIDLNLMNNYWAQAGGVEFSPNSGVLYANYYINSTNLLYQYNVNAGSAAAIRASKTKLEEIYFFGIFGGMQRGPDNKIYVATYGQPYVSVIHNPDVVGTGCNYVLQGLALANRSSHNFPAYMESKYYPEPDFTYSTVCPAQKVSFGYEKPDNIISVKWDFDDPASGSANTSTELDPVHEFSGEGTYYVKLIRFSNCKPDTLEKEISVKKISIDLGNDTAVCTNTGYLLNAPSGNTFDYLWQDGSTNNTLLASTSGLYWLQVTDPVSGCSIRDTIEITFNEISVNLGSDTTVCENAVLILDAGNQGFDYTWQDGSTNNSFAVNTPGLYIVTASSGNCIAKDSVQVNYNKKPVLNLGEDKQICGGETIILGAHLQNIYSYVWEDGSTAATRKINQSGTFVLTASNECGTESDDVIVRPGDCILAIPNAFTPDGDGKNDVFAISKTNLLPSFSMQVFNRWGQKIFETRDQSQGWNGTLSGRLCDTGNYAYVIQYRTIDGAPVVLKGMVLLLR